MRARLIALVTLAVGLFVGPATAAPILSVLPSTTTVNVGQQFSVDISISGLEGPPACDTGLPACTNLWGYQFDLEYNPTYLSVVPQGGAEVVDGLFLGSGGAQTAFVSGVSGVFDNPSDPLDPNNGRFGILTTLNVITDSNPGLFGGGVLATVVFEALAGGANTTSQLALFNLIFYNFDLDQFTPSVFDASVTVNPISAEVPEPTTLLLLGSGLAIAARRRQTRTRTTI